MKSFVTLLKNELKLNIRNMNMVIFAVIIPLVVLIILGFIYGTKPAADGTAYTFLEQSFVLEDSWGYPLWYQNTENEKF